MTGFVFVLGIGTALAESEAFNTFLEKYFPRFVAWCQARAEAAKLADEKELEKQWKQTDKHERQEKAHKKEVSVLKEKVKVAIKKAVAAPAAPDEAPPHAAGHSGATPSAGHHFGPKTSTLGMLPTAEDRDGDPDTASPHSSMHGISNELAKIKKMSRRVRKRRSSLTVSDHSAMAWSNAMQGLDVDGDGLLDLEEFEAVCKHGIVPGAVRDAAAQEAEIRELFGMLDEDGSGKVDVKELAHALKNDRAMNLAKNYTSLHKFVELVELKNKKKEFKKAFKAVDENGDGELCMKEFKAVCNITSENYDSNEANACRRLFELLDEDGGGTIDVREMSHALRYNEEAIRIAKSFDSLQTFVSLSEARKKKKKAISAARKSRIKQRKSMRRSMAAAASAAAAFGSGDGGGGNKKKGPRRQGTRRGRRGTALGNLEAVVEENPSGRRRRKKKKGTKKKKKGLQLVAAIHRVNKMGQVIAGLDKKTGKVVLVEDLAKMGGSAGVKLVGHSHEQIRMLIQHTSDCTNMKKIFREIGGVDDNEISAAEFAEFVDDCIPKFPGGVIPPTEDTVAAAFQHIDKDGSGLIDFREFEAWLGMAVEEAYKRVRHVIRDACGMDEVEQFWTDRAQWEKDQITVAELKNFVDKCAAHKGNQVKIDPGDVEMTFNYINTQARHILHRVCIIDAEVSRFSFRTSRIFVLQEHDGVLDRDEFDYFFFIRAVKGEHG